MFFNKKWLRLIIKNVIFNIIYGDGLITDLQINKASEIQSVEIKILLIHIGSFWNKTLRPYENSIAFPTSRK